VAGLRVVLITAPPDGAAALARALVEEGLAACVNVVPGITSHYQWEGAVCEDVEALLVVKTTEAGMAALTARVKALHPYRVPEVLALQVDEEVGNPDYLRWLRDSVSSGVSGG
jgi:periplasmic divalent cation tolerance protein